MGPFNNLCFSIISIHEWNSPQTNFHICFQLFITIQLLWALENTLSVCRSSQHPLKTCPSRVFAYAHIQLGSPGLSVSIYSKPRVSINGARSLCLFTLTSPQKLICWAKGWLSTNLPQLFRRSVQECREWAGCTASGLVLKTRGFVAQKGVKDTQGQTIQFLMWSCGTQTWERAQNNEKYADHDQDAHRAALAPPPLPFVKEKSLKNKSVCILNSYFPWKSHSIISD